MALLQDELEEQFNAILCNNEMCPFFKYDEHYKINYRNRIDTITTMALIDCCVEHRLWIYQNYNIMTRDKLIDDAVKLEEDLKRICKIVKHNFRKNNTQLYKK